MAEPFIDGGYVEFMGLERMVIVDPSNGEEAGTVPASGSGEVDQAVLSAAVTGKIQRFKLRQPEVRTPQPKDELV